MLHFHLIDSGQTHHHHYFTRRPMFWLTVSALLICTSLMTGKRHLRAVLALSAGTLLHMLLDTVAAPILWLMPFSDRSFEMVEIPAVYSNWIWSFVFHWTSALEITICAAALVLFLMRRVRLRANSAKIT